MSTRVSRLRQTIAHTTPDGLAIFLLAVMPLAYFWQAALRQAVFSSGDILLFFYPTHLAYADALRQGRLPLWEPRMLAGFPLYAEGQIGALYPLHPILYGLLPIDLATNYDILLHLGWVAIGTYLLARVIGLRPASAFLAGAVFAFGGFFLPRLAHMSVLATASWLPWQMWAFEQQARATERRKRLRWWTLFALFAGIQLLGGHPQFALMSALLVGLYSLVRWERGTDSHAGRMGRRIGPRLGEYFDPVRAIPVVLAFGAGALIAAVQLLPTFELATVSDRAAGLLPKFFHAFSLRLAHYLMLLHPFWLGNPYPRVSVEVIGYIGLLPLVLAIAAPLVRRNRRVAFFALIALVALLLGLGDMNPFYRGLRHLPLFNFFRVPPRFFFWYTWAMALLAATTFDDLLDRARATTRWTRGQRVALVVVLGALAVVVLLVPALPLDFWLALWVWLPIALAGFAAWIVLGARRGLFTRTTLTLLALGFALLDLALFGSVWVKTYDAMMPVEDFSAAPPTLAALKNLSPQNERVLTSTWIYPWADTMRSSLYPNVSLTYGVSSMGGYTPLLPQRTGIYLDNLNAPMLNLANVRYYLIPQMLPVDAATEGKDLENPFAPDFLQPHSIPPTPATRLQVVSSLAQSVDWRDGDTVAQIVVTAQDGRSFTFPLRAGVDTAEWAYERSDVRKVIRHSLPPIATTFPAESAFPTEAHAGHTYLAQFDLTREGTPLVVTGIAINPLIPAGLLHVERVRFVMPTGDEISLAHRIRRGDWNLVYRTNLVAVLENHDALPRAFLVHAARVADDAAALDAIRREDFEPRRALLLASGTPLATGDVQRADETVRVEEYQPERVTLSVQASAEGYVVLTDAWYPGWVARVDGVPVPIERADYIFRAVRVRAGTHRIEFEYQPASFYVGAVISAGALALLGALVVAKSFARTAT